MKQKKYISFVAIVLFSLLFAASASAAGTAIIPSGGPGYAPGKPCQLYTLTDDGDIFVENGTFNDNLDCIVSYGVVKNVTGENQTTGTLFSVLYNNILTAVQNGTALIERI